MRKSVALIVAAGLLVALAGCSSSESTAAGCTPQVSAGPASDLIAASGDYGTLPTVTYGTPLNTTTTQVTTLTKGDGAVLPADGIATLDFVLQDGDTGKTVSATKFDGKSRLVSSLSTIGLPGLEKALACATAGSRLAVAISPADGLGEAGASAVPTTDSLVMVVDVTQAFSDRADGAVQPAKAGFPSVALGPDGRPGITIPSADAPTEQMVTDLKTGSGPAVADGDSVWLKYTAVSWSRPATVSSSTWADGTPANVVASASGDVSTQKVPALVGETVGSQYIAVVPASTTSGSGSATVYVVDVLGISPFAPAAASQ